MNVMEGLQGVTPNSFPKHPVALLNEVLQNHGCKLDWRFRKPAATEETSDARRVDRGQASSEREGCFGIAIIADGPEISSEHWGFSKRSVKGKCAQEVLQKMTEDRGFLERCKAMIKTAQEVSGTSNSE
jgi:hypothetical protein